MNREVLIVIGVLIGAAVLFASNRIRSDLIAVFVLLTLMMSGVLTVAESLAGFSDPGKKGDVYEIMPFSCPTKSKSYPWAEANNPSLILKRWVFIIYKKGRTNS